MEDTLRYFFSAIFQGMAALFTLGSMFYISFLEKLDNKKKDMNNRADKYFRPADHEGFSKTITKSTIDNIVEYYIPLQKQNNKGTDPILVSLADEYTVLIEKQQLIKQKIKPVIKNSIIVLLISMICLFTVGYSEFLNYCNFIAGIVLIFFIFYFFMRLYKLIVITL